MPDLEFRDLDSLLKHFGFKERSIGSLHGAVGDCQLAALVYMELMQIPPLKMGELGFVMNEKE